MLVLVSGLVVPAGAALAQAAPPESGKLEEVVVTAQKRSQKLQSVPISVAVLGGKDIKAQNIINIDDLGTKIPNVEMVLPFGPKNRNSRFAA